MYMFDKNLFEKSIGNLIMYMHMNDNISNVKVMGQNRTLHGIG